MADATTGGLPAVKVGTLKPLADVYDELLVPGEFQGEAIHFNGKQIKDYAAAGAKRYNEEAKEHAEAAAKSAEEAEKSNQAAQESAERAESARDTAVESAESAAKDAAQAREDREHVDEVAQEVKDAREGIEEARDRAEQAADTATEAAKSAADSALSAKEYAGKPPVVINETWWVWNTQDQEYKDTGVKVHVIPKGDYDQEATYKRLDLVQYGGNSYIVLKECSGVTPSNDMEYYMLSARKGQDGTVSFDELSDEQREMIRGPKGEDGDTGPYGFNVVGENLILSYSDGPVPPFLPIGEDGHLYFEAENEVDLGRVVGPQGPQGIPGLSPTIEVSEVDGGHKITVTDAHGEESFEVKDGTVNFDELTPEQKASLKGDKGDRGPQGPIGPAGPGVPAGGNSGQILSKTSGTDYDTQWIDPPQTGVVSFNGRSGAVTPQAGDYTASDVEALPITGGTLTGNLNLGIYNTDTTPDLTVYGGMHVYNSATFSKNITATNGSTRLLSANIIDHLTVNGSTTLEGAVRLQASSSNYGSVLNFGDGDYVHISEPTDDNMEIKANKVNIVTQNANNSYFTVNGSPIGGFNPRLLYQSNFAIDRYSITQGPFYQIGTCPKWVLLIAWGTITYSVDYKMAGSVIVCKDVLQANYPYNWNVDTANGGEMLLGLYSGMSSSGIYYCVSAEHPRGSSGMIYYNIYDLT